MMHVCWLLEMMGSFSRNLLAGVEGHVSFFLLVSFLLQSRFFKHFASLVFNLVDFLRVEVERRNRN